MEMMKPNGSVFSFGDFSSIPKWSQTLDGNRLVTGQSLYGNGDVSIPVSILGSPYGNREPYFFIPRMETVIHHSHTGVSIRWSRIDTVGQMVPIAFLCHFSSYWICTYMYVRCQYQYHVDISVCQKSRKSKIGFKYKVSINGCAKAEKYWFLIQIFWWLADSAWLNGPPKVQYPFPHGDSLYGNREPEQQVPI